MCGAEARLDQNETGGSKGEDRAVFFIIFYFTIIFFPMKQLQNNTTNKIVFCDNERRTKFDKCSLKT